MCNPSLARKSVSVHLNKSSVDIDQLAGRLGGGCYFFYVGDGFIAQSFLFSEEKIATQFLNNVQFSPEFISGKIDENL